MVPPRGRPSIKVVGGLPLTLVVLISAIVIGRDASPPVKWAVCGIAGSALVIFIFSYPAKAASLEKSRAELASSRARVIAAGDAARRRIERDLHDGTQQRLLALRLELRRAEAEVPAGDDRLKARLSGAVQDVTDVIDDLREISKGVHPAALTKGGIGPALRSLARRSAVPVDLTVGIDEDLAEQAAVTLYYVVSEALANAAKHSHASVVRVDVGTEATFVRLSVRDDGVGGADPALGSGLIGLRDRVEAIGGRITVTSPAGEGTTLMARIPRARRRRSRFIL